MLISKEKVIKAGYDDRIIGYKGINKIHEIISRNRNEKGIR
jgi:hypothetical protein